VCGIMGYVGQRPAAPLLLEGLARLEYRGYDSAGIAVLSDTGDLHVTKRVGKLGELVLSLEGQAPSGSLGIGHTRWATHGRPSQDNAHPHQDCSGDIVVIHNGIVENYLTLKRDLQGAGHRFTSETDTEVIPHLIESHRPSCLTPAALSSWPTERWRFFAAPALTTARPPATCLPRSRRRCPMIR
jgi:glucosamine--fructose-6-phosphate aminotransferase (isomerizing)